MIVFFVGTVTAVIHWSAEAMRSVVFGLAPVQKGAEPRRSPNGQGSGKGAVVSAIPVLWIQGATNRGAGSSPTLR